MKKTKKTDRTIEKRNFAIEKLKTRKLDDGSEIRVAEGYASVFNSRTDIGGYYEEEIDPKAFDRCLEEKMDVRALFNHNWDYVLGRMSAETLKLSVDSKGLKFEIDLPDTTYAKNLEISMQRGDIRECSFGFVIRSEEWVWSESEGKDLVRITDVDLYEISIVTLPQYEDTTASIRSKDHIKHLALRKKILKQIGDKLNENA